MVSGSSINELEMEPMDAGKKLLHLPSLMDQDIHRLLSKLKKNLFKVEQKPSGSMKNALRPVIKALVAYKKLVRHPDLDVNILVSCCFCEILRICVPVSPYNDEELKDLFEMVVSTFEKLSYTAGGSYMKMDRVLEIFSRNNLSVLLLGPQLDGAGLVVRLFKQFLTVSSSNHAAIVLEMEKTMTTIIEVSVELKLDLVDRLVTFLKDINQIPSHDCWQPGEKVLMNFAARFKPYFPETHNIKTERLGTATCCQHFFYDPPQSVTEVKGKRKRNNNALEKQVTSSEDNAKIYVQGYEVKQSVAQTLEAILKKHGDIAANCIFKTSSMTSPILEVFCEIIKQIETNDVHEKMEEIERQVSDAEAVNIDVAWLRADLKAICEKSGSFERSYLVKETTKHTLLIERAARKDLEEMDVEVVAARERVGLAELLVDVFTIVEKNLDDKVMECKVKGDSWV